MLCVFKRCFLTAHDSATGMGRADDETNGQDFVAEEQSTAKSKQLSVAKP